MQYPQLPVVAFITAVLVIIPLPWHIKARNVATCAMMTWLFTVDIIYGVNALIWSGNVLNHAPVWCDITTKLVVGASYALPLCSVCVCKHLETVSSNRTVKIDHSDRRRRIIFELVMCIGVPIICMVLHYVVQGHRFDIVENLGCQATVYISIPAIMLIWFPQLLFSVIALIYASLALHHFITRRITFAMHLQHSNSALTTNRYLRLIAMSITEIVWGTAFTSLNLWNNVRNGLRPWTNWADVHSNFSRVDMYPQILIPPNFYSLILLFWWTLPASSIIFFVFFGFGEEALKEYRKVWLFLKGAVLRMDSQKPSSYSSCKFLTGSKVLHTPLSPFGQKHGLESLSSSFGATELELDAFPDVDVEKAGQCSTPSSAVSDPAPPKYSHNPDAESTSKARETPSDHADSTKDTTVAHSLRTQDSAFFLRSNRSDDRVYISQWVRPTRERSPSPAPFSDVVPPYHRPFTPPSIYPTALPHTRRFLTDAISVTIHTTEMSHPA